jgi:hypothetical protein
MDDCSQDRQGKTALTLIENAGKIEDMIVALRGIDHLDLLKALLQYFMVRFPSSIVLTELTERLFSFDRPNVHEKVWLLAKLAEEMNRPVIIRNKLSFDHLQKLCQGQENKRSCFWIRFDVLKNHLNDVYEKCYRTKSKNQKKESFTKTHHACFEVLLDPIDRYDYWITLLVFFNHSHSLETRQGR